MKITWFGHSCFRIDTGASSLLIDPFLKSNPTFQQSEMASHNVVAPKVGEAVTV